MEKGHIKCWAPSWSWIALPTQAFQISPCPEHLHKSKVRVYWFLEPPENTESYSCARKETRWENSRNILLISLQWRIKTYTREWTWSRLKEKTILKSGYRLHSLETTTASVHRLTYPVVIVICSLWKDPRCSRSWRCIQCWRLQSLRPVWSWYFGIRCHKVTPRTCTLEVADGFLS